MAVGPGATESSDKKKKVIEGKNMVVGKLTIYHNWNG